jgi:hypothetical protein
MHKDERIGQNPDPSKVMLSINKFPRILISGLQNSLLLNIVYAELECNGMRADTSEVWYYSCLGDVHQALTRSRPYWERVILI